MPRWPGITQFEMKDHVAIVTGGSKGLGEATAAGLASAGAHVALVSRHADEAQAAAEKIADEYSVRTIGLAADVTSEQDVQTMVNQMMAEFGQIDILINLLSESRAAM